MPEAIRTTIGAVLDAAQRDGFGKAISEGAVLARHEFDDEYKFLGRDVEVVDTGNRREVFLYPMQADETPWLTLVPISSGRQPDR